MDGSYIRVRLILGMLTGQHVWGHIFGRGYISGPNKQDFTVYKNSAVVSNFIHLDRIQIICKSLYASCIRVKRSQKNATFFNLSVISIAICGSFEIISCKESDIISKIIVYTSIIIKNIFVFTKRKYFAHCRNHFILEDIFFTVDF